MHYIYTAMENRRLPNFFKCCFLVALLFFTACDIFEYSPNQIILDDDEKNINEKNIRRLQAQNPDDTLRIILMGDTQRFYDEADKFVKSANQQKGIDIVIHAGDISDFGLSKEFIWVNEIMSGLRIPYVTVVGNHDLLANGPKVYKKMFGPLNFSFFYGGVKFIFFDSNSREYNFNGLVPDMDWIRQELADTSSYDEAILVSHIAPFDDDFDPVLGEQYATLMAENKKVKLSLHGHQHSFSSGDFFDDGMTYVVTTTVNKKGYALITLYGGASTIQKVNY